MLTNGERIGEVGPFRQFKEIARHNGFVWVEVANGPPIDLGQMLTFAAHRLFPLPEKTK